jgi:ABC-2 type transport system ATP-binding protein
MPEAAVSVRGLVKKYGDLTAVDKVSFEAARGEIFALLGPNGAGKTTTVEILECIRTPTSGTVRVLGHDAATPEGAREIKRRIGILPQDFNTLQRLTVAENLRFFAGMYDMHSDIEGLLDLLGLRDKANIKFGDLSGGLKQRVGVASALVNDPEVVFLDEPTTGLDPEIRRATWKIIEDMSAKGKTVLLTTHYMDEAQHLADKIAIMVQGKVAALDSPSGLVKTYGGGKSMVFKGGGDPVFGTLRRFFDSTAMEGNDVVLPFEDTKDIQVALTALMERGINVEVSLRTESLEDVFLKLAGFRMPETGEAP